MGISPFSKIKIADISNRKLSPAMTASIEQVVSEALARRPDTLTAYAAHEASLANLRAARAEFLPKVFVAATGSYTMGNLSLSGLPSIEQQPATLNLSQHNLGATVLMGITVPVYDAGVRDAMWEQAKANVDKSNAALEETRNEAMRDVVAAGNAAKTSLSAYDAAHALMSAAQTTFDAALQSYRHDVGTITAVTTAETQLLLAENAATDAYSNALSSAATLALSAGTLGAAPE
jgi:outer membrane protein TolC